MISGLCKASRVLDPGVDCAACNCNRGWLIRFVPRSQALRISNKPEHRRACRRDCANGFLVAEMLSRHFPADASMHAFANGTSTATRADNWAQVQKACRRNGFQLPRDLVAGSQREDAGAANALLEMLYEHLTGKALQHPEEARATLFTLTFVRTNR